MERSVFSKMIAGEWPCFRVFEDEYTFAFLARESLNPGHVLIVPKIEVDDFVDLPEPDYSAIFRNSKRLAKAIRAATGCKRVGTLTGGWEIPHFHYHLVPMNDPYDMDPRRAKRLNPEENLAMQKKIVDCLGELED